MDIILERSKLHGHHHSYDMSMDVRSEMSQKLSYVPEVPLSTFLVIFILSLLSGGLQRGNESL